MCFSSLIQGVSTSRILQADSTDEVPIRSPLTPPVLAIGSGKTEDQQQKSVFKPAQVQAILKCIKQVENPPVLNMLLLVKISDMVNGF